MQKILKNLQIKCGNPFWKKKGVYRYLLQIDEYKNKDSSIQMGKDALVKVYL